MSEKMVHCGQRQTCSTCCRDISKGEIALRRSDRAVTFHERCHMDGHGMVNRYHHSRCRGMTIAAHGAEVAQ